MLGRRKQASTRAFTLVEVILTILIVGVGLVASMRALPVLLQVSQATSDHMTAQQLATDLLAEIAMLPYEDPDGSTTFGCEPGESAQNRADFDDVDDYDGWSASPPQTKDGQAEPDCAGYTRSVLVQSTNPNDFNNIEGDSVSKPKRITITVSRTGMPPIVVTTVRLQGSNREDLE
jgi:prepilin-type N-terminal cleavage/methylation domain-containing protein